MTTEAKVYRDRCGVYVGLVPGFPEITAVGYTAEELRDNLRVAVADLIRSGRLADASPQCGGSSQHESEHPS
jgi:predicted RNase H-like HicB family nuclease